MRAAILTGFAAALVSFASAPLVFAADDSPAQPRQLSIANRPWTGDFDRMVARRMIRVLVPYSRTLYYTDKGRERGLTAELVRDFEQYVNQKYKTGKRPVTFYLIPTTRDKLLPELAAGLGDVAAGNLTATDERLKLVDFVTQTDRPAVKELVVTSTKAPAVALVDGLSGRTVHVRKASSYYESLVALNARFAAEGKPPVRLRLVPDALEDEDMMEMANAGLIDVLIVDDWKARLWATILPNLRIDDAVFVRDGGHIGWAIRKHSPQLAAAIRRPRATGSASSNCLHCSSDTVTGTGSIRSCSLRKATRNRSCDRKRAVTSARSASCS